MKKTCGSSEIFDLYYTNQRIVYVQLSCDKDLSENKLYKQNIGLLVVLIFFSDKST